MIKTAPNMPVAPPSGQQSTKPASPPKSPSVKPPTPMGKAEGESEDSYKTALNTARSASDKAKNSSITDKRELAKLHIQAANHWSELAPKAYALSDKFNTADGNQGSKVEHYRKEAANANKMADYHIKNAHKHTQEVTMDKAEPISPMDEAMKARNEVIKQGHEEHRKTSVKPLVGQPLEELHRKAWKAHDDKYKELTGTWIGPHHSGNYLHTPTEKSEKSNSKTHVKEFIVPISKGGMLRWHSACIKGDDSAKGQVIKGRSPDAEYSREAASGLPGVCTGCSGELGKDPNNVPVPPQDLSTEKSEADIANLSMTQDKVKSKFLDPLKHHYAHLLQAHKLGKGEQANKSANMCAVYLRLLDLAAVPEELKNNSGVNLSKTEHPFDKEARKLAKTLTMDTGSSVPSSDTQGAAMMKHWDEDKEQNPHLEQAKKLRKESLKGWGNDFTITDRDKAVQAVALYRKGGHNHLANHLQSILDNKNAKDLYMKKNEDNSMKKNEECDPGTYEPLNKMRGYMNRLAKCGEMAIVKAEHNPKGIQNPNTSGQGHHPDHTDNPYHDTIVSHGYKYSHSTPVYGPSVTTKLGSPPERNVYLHHTYKHGTLKDHNVTIAMKNDKPHHWAVSVSGSGLETRGNDPQKLNSFLKGHVSRAKKKTI